MITQTINLDEVVQQFGALYSWPAVGRQIVEPAAGPAWNCAQLKSVVECDPALAAKVLRIVNGAIAFASGPVVDLDQALALVGDTSLKLLLLGFNLPDDVAAGATGDVLARYWRRSLIRAEAAHLIAERFWNRRGSEAYLAGLLSELGILALIQHIGTPYVELLNAYAWSSEDLLAQERQELGYDHAQLTARLIVEAKLPRTMVDFVSDACAREAAASRDKETLASIQQMADLVTLMLAEERFDFLPRLAHLADERCRATRDDVDRLLDDVRDRIDVRAEILSLDAAEGLDSRDILDRAHRQLAAAASEAVGELFDRQCQTPHAQADADLLDSVRSLSEEVASAAQPLRPTASSGSGKRGRKPRAGGKRVRADGAVKSSGRAPVMASSNAAVLDRLATAATDCRVARCALGFMLVEIDRYAEIVASHGPPRGKELLDRLETACRAIEQSGADSFPLREGRYAIVVSDCDHQRAAALAASLGRAMRELDTVDPATRCTVSIGVATVALPTNNFRAEAFWDRASQCLAIAQASGGDSVQSVEA